MCATQPHLITKNWRPLISHVNASIHATYNFTSTQSLYQL